MSSTNPSWMSDSSSAPACRWYESGGSPEPSRDASTACALVPAPPATAASTISTSGYRSANSASSASLPSESPPPVHHEKNSNSPVASSVGTSWAPSPSAAAPLPSSSSPPQATSASDSAATNTAGAVARRFRCVINNGLPYQFSRRSRGATRRSPT